MPSAPFKNDGGLSAAIAARPMLLAALAVGVGDPIRDERRRDTEARQQNMEALGTMRMYSTDEDGEQEWR